jgi:hypothetical protein
MTPSPSCRRLLVQLIRCALFLALASAGNNIPARIAIMAITTRSSIKVKPLDLREKLAEQSSGGHPEFEFIGGACPKVEVHRSKRELRASTRVVELSDREPGDMCRA